jgi:hypothetical protein
MVLAQKQTWRPVEQNRGLGYESTRLYPPYFWQKCQSVLKLSSSLFGSSYLLSLLGTWLR